jgi:hypothetical protein
MTVPVDQACGLRAIRCLAQGAMWNFTWYKDKRPMCCRDVMGGNAWPFSPRYRDERANGYGSDFTDARVAKAAERGSSN